MNRIRRILLTNKLIIPKPFGSFDRFDYHTLKYIFKIDDGIHCTTVTFNLDCVRMGIGVLHVCFQNKSIAVYSNIF